LELNHRFQYQALCTLVLSVIWLTGCASSSSRLLVPIAGALVPLVNKEAVDKFLQSMNETNWIINSSPIPARYTHSQMDGWSKRLHGEKTREGRKQAVLCWWRRNRGRRTKDDDEDD